MQVLFKGREPFAFTAAFHGWSKHLEGSKVRMPVCVCVCVCVSVSVSVSVCLSLCLSLALSFSLSPPPLSLSLLTHGAWWLWCRSCRDPSTSLATSQTTITSGSFTATTKVMPPSLRAAGFAHLHRFFVFFFFLAHANFPLCFVLLCLIALATETMQVLMVEDEDDRAN